MIALWDRVKSIDPSDVEHRLMWGEEQGPGIAGGAIPSINKLVSGVYGGDIRGGVIAYIPVEPPAQGEVGVVLPGEIFQLIHEGDKGISGLVADAVGFEANGKG
jgi:hypothetical protein